jgi:ethylbenzene hydroxylase subunit gamma/complex iron-sulfur molybdoenzyme family reductase subunit gamma
VKARRIATATEDLGTVDPGPWASAAATIVPLEPTPLALVEDLSPQMASRAGHGAVRSLRFQAVHNRSHLAIRVGWQMPEAHAIGDLDQYADAVAVMFPMHRDAVAMTMGAMGRPVNAWYWRAGDSAPFDVLAEGLGTSSRRDSKLTALSAQSSHGDGAWVVTFVRPLVVEADAARFEPGVRTGVAFSVWDGGRAERAALKSSSLVFSEFELEA